MERPTFYGEEMAETNEGFLLSLFKMVNKSLGSEPAPQAMAARREEPETIIGVPVLPNMGPASLEPLPVDRFIDRVLEKEGGFVNDKADVPTKFGVTQDTLSAWLGKPASVKDVRSLDEKVARDIYRSQYFEGPGIDKLPPEIVEQVFDISVNSGPSTSVRLLQESLNEAGWKLEADGVLGEETYKAAWEAANTYGKSFNNVLVERRKQFYKAVAKAQPAKKKFLNGWLARARKFNT